MKIFVEITVFRNYDERILVEEFQTLYPQGRKGLGFQIKLAPEDPLLKEIIATAQAKGIPRVDYSSGSGTKKPRPKYQYSLEYHRTYEPTDFDSAAYLWMKHEVLITEDQERDDQGRLLLPARKLKPGLRMGCVLFEATVVSEGLRQEMLEAGLIGPLFKEIVVDGKASTDFWELVSSVSLPAMPRERLIPRPIAPDDYLNLSGIRDGEFAQKEIHYWADEIQQIEPFDFGLTLEQFGGERRPIVAQKFRQFCLAQKLNLSWVPVRVDPR